MAIAQILQQAYLIKENVTGHATQQFGTTEQQNSSEFMLTMLLSSSGEHKEAASITFMCEGAWNRNQQHIAFTNLSIIVHF